MREKSDNYAKMQLLEITQTRTILRVLFLLLLLTLTILAIFAMEHVYLLSPMLFVGVTLISVGQDIRYFDTKYYATARQILEKN